MALWQKWVVSNPVFRYHFLGQTKMMVRRPAWLVLLISAIFLSIYIWLLHQAYQNGVPSLTAGLECLALWLIAPLMTHSLFAAEFEKATWDMLVLTRLTAGQIVMGKFLSRLVVLLFAAILFVIPLWIGAVQDYQTLSGVQIFVWLMKTQFVIVGWAILLVAVTLWLSYWLKRGMVAAAVAFAGQVFVLFIVPILWGLFSALFIASERASFDPLYFGFGQEEWLKYGWMFDIRFAVWFYNPAIALTVVFALLSEMRAEQPILWGFWQGLIYLLLAGLIVALLTKSVAKATRKPI